METVQAACRICGENAQEQVSHVLASGTGLSETYIHFVCPFCGEIFLSDAIADRIEDGAVSAERMKVACAIRERRITSHPRKAIVLRVSKPSTHYDRPVLLWDDLVNDFPKTLSERLDRGLVNLTKMTPDSFGDVLPQGPLLFRALFAMDTKEADFFERQLAETGDVTIEQLQSGKTGVLVTARGWQRSIRLQEVVTNRQSRTAFFAFNMSDLPLARTLESAFRESAKRTGYDAVIVSAVEHNDQINDRIFYELNRARFVVCDMTGQRQNVYFEAGYARGMEHQLIWCCKEEEVSNLHFDIRQFNHVLWESETDLVERLTNRINATIR